MKERLSPADKRWLQTVFAEAVRFDEPMTRHTSFRVGGPADAFVKPPTAEAAARLFRWAWKNGVKCHIIGDGTNLLVPDEGVRGVVMKLGRSMTGIHQACHEDPFKEITAWAGARLKTLCRFARERGLEGTAFAVGIPGTVGGAIRMNAGTSKGSIGEILSRITILWSDGRDEILDRKNFRSGYRSFKMVSGGPDTEITGAAIIDAAFRLECKGRPPGQLEIEAKKMMAHRLLRQPLRFPSAGCFFKNPSEENPAGRLIDLAGLKGMRVGDACISDRHANFIINKGGARACDILALADIVRETVFRRSGIVLEPEVSVMA